MKVETSFLRLIIISTILCLGCVKIDNNKVKLAKLDVEKALAALKYQELETKRIEKLCNTGAVKDMLKHEARYKLRIKEIEYRASLIKLEQSYDSR